MGSRPQPARDKNLQCHSRVGEKHSVEIQEIDVGQKRVECNNVRKRKTSEDVGK